MIPYIHIPPLSVGGIVVVQPFGLLLATGCIAGWLVARREARLRGLDETVIDGCVFWALLAGFLGSRLAELVFYSPQGLWAAPWRVFFFWEAMSSLGGIIAGAAAVVGYFAWTRSPVLAYLDCFMPGFVTGWFFGRLGCSIIHDHPGLPTSFPLGVRYPDTVRHDLGLYEWLFTAALLAAIFAVRRTRLAPGMLTGAIALAYAPVRFGLDFLRVGDQTHHGLTFAQYGSIGLLAIGVVLVARAARTRRPRGNSPMAH